MKVGRFQDLEVYRASLHLQQEIFLVSQRFPREEKFSLVDQIRRASRSIGANLAEAWSKRTYLAHFTCKLTDADGENAETRHWLLTAQLCAYLDQAEFRKLDEQAESVGRMLGVMIKQADQWCLPSTRSN